MAAPQHARMAAAAGPAAAARNEFDTSDDEDDEDAGEASTTIGAAQLAAAADRTAAASRLAGLRANSGSNAGSNGNGGGSILQQREMHIPPRVPAPSPVINSPAALTQQQQQGQLLQAAADRMVQDSLATPMSHLSISRRPGGAQHNAPAAGAGEAMTPGSMLVDRSLSRGAAALPASPAEKLIGLMMSPGAEGHRTHHHHHHQQQQQQQQLLTPSRLSAALGGGGSGVQAPPLSPNLQVIGLMMQGEALAEGAGAAAAGSSGEEPAAAQQQGAQDETGVGAVGGANEGEARGSRASSGGDEGSDDDGSSSGSDSVFESDDEMDLSELQALCGEGVGPDTPLSVILGMMLSPQVAGLTPHLGAEEEQQQQQQAANDDLNPRILFADD